MNLILYFYLFLYLPLAQAEGQSGSTAFYAGLGQISQNIAGKISSSDTGSKNFFGQTYLPELVIGLKAGGFFPSLGYTILGKKSNDGDKKRGLLTLMVSYALAGGPDIGFKVGTGFQVYRIYGSGSTVTLGNGTSTQAFYVPDGAKGATNAFLSAGGYFELSNGIRLDADLVATGLVSTRRALSLYLRGGYVF